MSHGRHKHRHKDVDGFDAVVTVLIIAAAIISLIPAAISGAVSRMEQAKAAKPRLDPMLRKLGLKIPFIRFRFYTPAPEEIRALRVAAGLTQEQAAESVGLGKSGRMRWAEYEAGSRSPDVARWTLFQLITRGHPEWRLKRNKGGFLVRK